MRKMFADRLLGQSAGKVVVEYVFPSALGAVLGLSAYFISGPTIQTALYQTIHQLLF